jgi:hypothetical protein
VLYAAARGIVAIVPTPADQALVNEIGVILQAIAKLFGLDIMQGIKYRVINGCKVVGWGKNFKKMAAVIAILCFLTLALSGCASPELTTTRTDPNGVSITYKVSAPTLLLDTKASNMSISLDPAGVTTFSVGSLETNPDAAAMAMLGSLAARGESYLGFLAGVPIDPNSPVTLGPLISIRRR